MAKKITAIIRLRIPAGRHDGGPVAARALGRRGVNLEAFARAFRASSPRDDRSAIPLIVTVYEDTSFSLAFAPPQGASACEPALAT